MKHSKSSNVKNDDAPAPVSQNNLISFSVSPRPLLNPVPLALPFLLYGNYLQSAMALWSVCESGKLEPVSSCCISVHPIDCNGISFALPLSLDRSERRAILESDCSRLWTSVLALSHSLRLSHMANWILYCSVLMSTHSPTETETDDPINWSPHTDSQRTYISGRPHHEGK